MSKFPSIDETFPKGKRWYEQENMYFNFLWLTSWYYFLVYFLVASHKILAYDITEMIVTSLREDASLI